MTHRARFSVSILIWLHVLVVIFHGMAHGGDGVPFTSLSSNALVVLAIGVGIGIAPLVALFLLSTRWFLWGGVAPLSLHAGIVALRHVESFLAARS